MNVFFKNTAYRAIVTAKIFNSFGSNLYSLIFLIYAATLPYKTLAVSISSIAMIIPGLLGMIDGWLADHTKHKLNAIYLTTFVQLGLYTVIAFLINDHQQLLVFIMFVGLHMVSSFLGGYTNNMNLFITKHNVAKTDLNAAFSFNQAVGQISDIIAQVVGVSLIVLVHNNFGLIAFVNGLTFVIAGTILYTHRKILNVPVPKIESAEVQVAQNSLKAGLKAAFAIIKANGQLQFLLFATLMINGIGVAIDPLMNLYLLDAKNIWVGNYGNTVVILNIVFSVGLIIGALLPNDIFKKLSFFQLIIVILAMFIAISLAVVLGAPLWGIAVAFFGGSYMMAKIGPRLSTYMVSLIPDHQLGVIGGAMNMMFQIGIPVGQVSFIGIANFASPIIAFEALVAMSLVSSGVLITYQIILKGRAKVVEQN